MDKRRRGEGWEGGRRYPNGKAERPEVDVGCAVIAMRWMPRHLKRGIVEVKQWWAWPAAALGINAIDLFDSSERIASDNVSMLHTSVVCCCHKYLQGKPRCCALVSEDPQSGN